MLTICASTAYAAGECAGISHSFNGSPRNATLFYAANIGIALLAAAVIVIPGAPLLSIALNANVQATIVLVGVHPRLTQTPPSAPRSTSATFWAALASSTGKNRPPWLVPITIAS